MKNNINYMQLRDASRLFGSLFYRAQNNHETLYQIVYALQEMQLIDEECHDHFSALSQAEYDAEYLYLFEGCGHMPAPPWSSVYLDKETVLFGETTIEYRRFLTDVGVKLDTDIREPEDQFGLMLLMLSYLSECESKENINTLLTEHLFTWCFYYLELVNKNAKTEFYSSLAKHVSYWLTQIKQELNISVYKKEIYFINE